MATNVNGDALPADWPAPDWEMWRTRGACRIWKAVMISMGVRPTTRERDRLRQENPERYAEFRRRTKDVVAQFGLHHELQATQHHNAGDAPADQYIMLRSLLNFAKEHHWKDLNAFEQGMLLSTPQTVAARKAYSTFEALPLGQRHALVRTGALLQLLEEVLLKGVEMNAASLLHGGNLNISQVASRVEKIIGSSAEQEKVDNFKAEANRKQFNDARHILRTYL